MVLEKLEKKMWYKDKSNQGFWGLNKLKKTQYDNDHYGLFYDLRSVGRH